MLTVLNEKNMVQQLVQQLSLIEYRTWLDPEADNQLKISLLISIYQPWIYRDYFPWWANLKVLPYSLPSIGPGAEPCVQAVSPQVTFLSYTPAVGLGCRYFPPGLRPPSHLKNVTSTESYCLMTKAHRCEQLVLGCYAVCLGGNWTRDLLIASPMP